MKKIKIYIDSTIAIWRACYVFSFQYRKISAFFKDSHIYEISQKIYDSDYIIILSCVISSQFYNKSINDINNYSFKYPDKKIISYGCYTKFSEANDTDQIFYISHENTNKFNKIFNLDKKLPIFTNVDDIAIENEEEYYLDKKNEQIVVWHGCTWDCSYCNHKYTKKLSSFSTEYILRNIELRIKKGINHFRITSDDVTSYWLDKNDGINYIELVKNILEKFPNITISLWPLFPNFLNKFDELYEILETWRVLELFIAIEHLSNKILKNMNRHYNANEVLTNVWKIKTNFPNIKISTHIIYWFIWEDLNEFKKIFIITNYFDQVQFFKLSKSKRLEEKLWKNVKIDKFLNLKEKILIKFYESRKGYKLFTNHRLVVIKENFISNKDDLNEWTF